MIKMVPAAGCLLFQQLGGRPRPPVKFNLFSEGQSSEKLLACSPAGMEQVGRQGQLQTFVATTFEEGGRPARALTPPSFLNARSVGTIALTSLERDLPACRQERGGLKSWKSS